MYEDLSKSKYISCDIETYDPELLEKGPGVYRSTPLNFTDANGYILGVSLVDEHNNKGYYGLGHYDITPEQRTKNYDYLLKSLGTNAIKIGANLMYDLDWLENWAMIPVNGNLIDVQIAEPLLDETQRHYNLDFMGKKYFGGSEGKAKGEIDKFCYENGFKGDPRKYLWKMPTYMVEAYALQDVYLPMKIWGVQEKQLIEEDMLDLMHLECDLLRVLLLMRKSGVKIDTKVRDKYTLELINRVETTKYALEDQLGYSFNFNSTKQLAKILDSFEVPYPETAKGNPSIKREHLIRLSKGQVKDYNGNIIADPIKMKLGKDLADIRRAEKVLKTFLHGSLVNFVTKGDLIHCSFHSMMTDAYGTKSGRFSSSNPNLQQIPAPSRDKYYGTMSRAPFIPSDNCLWGKLDYSQIEYRFMAHFAKGEGSDEVRAKYNNDPTTDYHRYIQDLTGLERPQAKTVNFGVAFGMGAEKMASENQWDLDYCYSILNTYHKNAPFVKSTIRAVEQVSKRRGYIKTILNRRARLTDPNKAYVMYNRLVQGSAADLMKKAMLEAYKAGIFEILTLHITVHDELDVSVPKTKEGIDTFFKLKYIMENCMVLRVPIIADAELGTNWADLKEVTKEEAYELIKEETV